MAFGLGFGSFLGGFANTYRPGQPGLLSGVGLKPLSETIRLVPVNSSSQGVTVSTPASAAPAAASPTSADTARPATAPTATASGSMAPAAPQSLPQTEARTLARVPGIGSPKGRPSVAERNNNPGNIWISPIARKYGATTFENVSPRDQTATFSTKEDGAAAMFALFGTKGYLGKTVEQAIYRWSNGTNPAYPNFVEKHSGIPKSTVITRDFLASPEMIRLTKAMARYESGYQRGEYPLSDPQWRAAQLRVFGAPSGATAASVGPAAGVASAGTPQSAGGAAAPRTSAPLAPESLVSSPPDRNSIGDRRAPGVVYGGYPLTAAQPGIGAQAVIQAPPMIAAKAPDIDGDEIRADNKPLPMQYAG